jgi:hypothetical protein
LAAVNAAWVQADIRSRGARSRILEHRSFKSFIGYGLTSFSLRRKSTVHSMG